jgi:hypothetical protein
MSSDGLRWYEQTAQAEWAPRYLASMVGDSTGAIYIAGGILQSFADRRATSGEVWRSINQGRVWRQINTEETIASGAGNRAVSLLLRAGSDRLIWMTGVNSGYVGTDYESYYKDVWASTNLGRNFYAVNLNTPFGRRDDANGEITDAGLMILAGGYAGTLTGEIYNDGQQTQRLSCTACALHCIAIANTDGAHCLLPSSLQCGCLLTAVTRQLHPQAAVLVAALPSRSPSLTAVLVH